MLVAQLIQYTPPCLSVWASVPGVNAVAAHQFLEPRAKLVRPHGADEGDSGAVAEDPAVDPGRVLSTAARTECHLVGPGQNGTERDRTRQMDAESGVTNRQGRTVNIDGPHLNRSQVKR